MPTHVMSAEERRANSTDSTSTAHEIGALRCSATTSGSAPGKTLLGPIRQASLDLLSSLPPDGHTEPERQSIFQDVLEQVNAVGLGVLDQGSQL